MSRHLVFVHGRDFKPSSGALWALWEEALGSAIQRHYGDAMHAFSLAEKSWVYFGDLTNERLQALGRTYNEDADVADRGHALTRLKAIRKRDFLSRRRYEELPGRTPLKEFVADVGMPVLNAFRLAERVIERVTPEYASYWNDEEGYGTKLRKGVRDALTPLIARREEIMLITHCLGSIAAYDALWELDHERDEDQSGGRVSLWLTFGSPLGDEAVKRRLKGARERKRRYPTNVTEWINVSAEDDYISHDKTVADDFDAMVKSRGISRIRDYRIYNLATRFGKSNPHNALGFLSHPRVAKIVSDWLLRGSGARMPVNDNL